MTLATMFCGTFHLFCRKEVPGALNLGEDKSPRTLALLRTAKSEIQAGEIYGAAEDQSRLMEPLSQDILTVELRVLYRNPAHAMAAVDICLSHSL